MARQPASVPIVSDRVDLFMGRVLGATAATLFTFVVLSILWHWIVR